MITVTISNLLAYYGLGLIAWMFICEVIPFKWHVRAFCFALAYCGSTLCIMRVCIKNLNFFLDKLNQP